MDLNQNEVAQLNGFQNFLKFKFTWQFRMSITTTANKLLLIFGNQSGKTGGIAFSYVLRILGQHPVPKKNILYFECENKHAVAPYKLPADRICKDCGEELKEHERGSRTFRFCSATLPGQTGSFAVDGGSAEVKNTQYPEFKKWLPPFLVKKDITVRNPAMIISDPFGGKDIVVEFVSYNQSVQSTAGTQRVSVWCDESPDMEFYDEQLPRLLAEDGDIVFTYTPVDRSSWLFDELFEKARVIYRTKRICDFLSTTDGEVSAVERTESPYDIAVIMAATDDNPTLDPDVVEAMFDHVDDPDTVAIRRYGIFKQLSGRIFKDFEYKTHVIGSKEFFPDGIPDGWTHARGIDFHSQTPWAIGWMALSPQNEAFIYMDYNPSPEKCTIKEISETIVAYSDNTKFRLNLIDPYAETVKKNNISVMDDINREFKRLKKEGDGLGGHWQTWNTKGEKGRDVIRSRLKNSKLVERPFNNKRVTASGKTEYLPTIWILDNCKTSAKCMRSWRWEEWSDPKMLRKKEAKNTPEQKWSHINMVWEALFKHKSFRPRRAHYIQERNINYFDRGK